MNGQAYQENLLWSLAAVIFIIVTSYAIGKLAQAAAYVGGVSARERQKIFWGFAFAGPWISGFLIFVLGPSLASLYYSFTDYKIGDPIQWIGIENYRTLILGDGAHGRRFNQALFNSFYYALLGVPLQIMAALAMAMLLNRNLPGIKAFRTTFYLPVILAGSPAALLAWRYMFSSNGGFVNNALQSIAESFFLFDYAYRSFIYSVETFSGFYAGLARGNPVGPLKYTLPALLFLLAILPLMGERSEGKRVLAWRLAQLFGLAVLAFTLPIGIVQPTVDPVWTWFAGLVMLGFVLINARDQKRSPRLLWQVGGLLAIGISAVMTLDAAAYTLTEGALTYLIPMLIISLPLIGAFFGAWERPKFIALSAVVGLFALVIFVRALPGQSTHFDALPRYLTFGSTLETTEDAAYLEEVYPYESLSSLWVYGLAAAVLVGVALLDNYPAYRRGLLIGAGVFFLLFGLSTYLDGRAYFNAFNEIAEASGRPNYHFALYHQAADTFPTSDRVPLWMTNELWSKPSMLLITVWSSGAGMLIFLAALKGVPPSLYEAAEVDGANGWQKFIKITLPMISPAMFYNIVIGVIAALQTFENVYIIRTTQTEDSLASAAFFLFTRTFRQLSIGEGASASWILAVIIVTLTVLQFRWSKWVHYEA